MIPIVTSLLSTLASNGLGMLAGALQAKGKEVIENKLGIKIPDDLTPELIQELKIREMQHEEFLLDIQLQKSEINLRAEEMAGIAVTGRWIADMNSDSWLSKNIRPMTLIYILVLYTIFGLMSAAGILVTPAYVELLGQWGMLIMSAYFVGRTVEKGINAYKGAQE